MDYRKLRSILLKSYIGIFMIVFIILGAGVSIFVLLASTNHGMLSNILKIIFGGAFTGLGGFVLYKKLPDFMAIFSGNLPVLKALKEGDKDYVVWIYRQQIDTTMGNGGATVGSTNNVMFYDRNGHSESLVLRKTPAEDVIAFLKEEFPEARVGYDKKTRKEVSAILNKKL